MELFFFLFIFLRKQEARQAEKEDQQREAFCHSTEGVRVVSMKPGCDCGEKQTP